MQPTSSLIPRFAIAKYASDIARMEPRNIGVFLWSRGDILAKFLEQKDASTIINDGELDVYARWVAYWQKNISGDVVTPRRGKPVPKSSPASIEALLKTQKGNYILEDGGELVESLRKKDHHRALDFLFKTLVATEGKQQRSGIDASFRAKCLAILNESGISSRDDYRPKYPVELNVYGQTEELHFSYGFGNGHPEALIQRVQLSNEDSVVSSLLKLQTVVYSSSIIRADRLRIMYRKSDINKDFAEKAYARLASLCEAIDVESADAVDSLKRLLSA